MAKAFRRDRGTLRAPIYLADGSAIVEAVITRAGVFEYRADDGINIVREYRSPKEVFNPNSMRSFEHMAVTLHHPREGLVTIENRSALGKGSVLEGVRRDGNDLVARLHITDGELLRALKAGTVAVSCGYEQHLVKGAGVTEDGERYDAAQTDIEGNHVAIVDVARAGDVARVRMDSATMIAGSSPVQESTMFKTIEEATAAYNAEKLAREQALASYEAQKQVAVGAQKLASEATARADAADEKATKSEKLRVDGEKNAIANARARVSLEDTAAKVLRTDGEEAPKFEGKTDTEIKISVIEKLTGKPLASEKRADAAYVAARYDAAIESEADAEKSLGDVREGVRESGHRNDAANDDVKKAREEMIKRNASAREDNLKRFGKGA